MEITDSLAADIKNAPKWFHEAISNKPKIKSLSHQLGNITYQEWDRKKRDIIVLIHGTGAHKKWWDPIAPLISENYSIIAPDLP